MAEWTKCNSPLVSHEAAKKKKVGEWSKTHLTLPKKVKPNHFQGSWHKLSYLKCSKCWPQWLTMSKKKVRHHNVFVSPCDRTWNCSHSSVPVQKKGACGLKCNALKEHKSVPPPALNHSLPPEFISHQTSDSSARSNKKLNSATHSLEVKPSLSSDSSGRKGWGRCAKSRQASSPAASDSYWHLF